MKVSQYVKGKELLKFHQVQSQKPSSAMMKLALMRTATRIVLSTGQWPNRQCKGYFTKKESDGVLIQMTWLPQSPYLNPNWDGLGWVGPQREGKAANKCSSYVGSPSKLLEKHSRWSWLRECQECAKLSSRQKVAIWRITNIKCCLICLTLFWLLHDSICVIS